jgi:hypothetical protein
MKQKERRGNVTRKKGTKEEGKYSYTEETRRKKRDCKARKRKVLRRE